MRSEAIKDCPACAKQTIITCRCCSDLSSISWHLKGPEYSQSKRIWTRQDYDRTAHSMLLRAIPATFRIHCIIDLILQVLQCPLPIQSALLHDLLRPREISNFKLRDSFMSGFTQIKPCASRQSSDTALSPRESLLETLVSWVRSGLVLQLYWLSGRSQHIKELRLQPQLRNVQLIVVFSDVGSPDQCLQQSHH